MKHKQIYLAGPMTGLPEYNFPAFHTAAQRLRELGATVYNPAESFDGRTDLPRAQYMRKNIDALNNTCDAIAFLPGWQISGGSLCEWMIALQLGYAVYMLEDDASYMKAAAGLPVVPIGIGAPRLKSAALTVNGVRHE